VAGINAVPRPAVYPSAASLPPTPVKTVLPVSRMPHLALHPAFRHAWQGEAASRRMDVVAWPRVALPWVAVMPAAAARSNAARRPAC